MKSKENIEKKGLRRLSDEELKEVTGGALSSTLTGIEIFSSCRIYICPKPGQPYDPKTCKCVD